MPASTTGSKTATGSVTLNKDRTDTITMVQLSGTYGTVTLVLEGSLDGTNFGALAAIRFDTRSVATGTLSPSDNTTYVWAVPSEGLAAVRARVTAIASGTADFSLSSATYSDVPVLSNSQTVGSSLTAQTFTGDVTLSSGADLAFSGTTGQSQITVPDNLASALNVVEGSNSYLKFVTTDSAERIVVGKKFTLPVVATPVAATGAAGGVSGAAALSLNNLVYISSDGATKGVKFPTSVAGDFCFVLNTSSTAANLFAASGGTINGGAGDAGCTVPASKGVLAFSSAADTWTVFDFTAHAGAAA